ncbi:hypothetical protein C5167_048731 [Papaver somniferum]|uniref:Uncharacterized protein n=1 Tax=Papaver somniferum TaxID=3469 RepID=A0A4Y7KLI8_PAPSO|nr:hypothetical protein C5167_048731 [Papaver somniferum]
MIHYAVSHDIEKVLVNLFMAVKKDYPTLLVYQSKWKSELQFCKDCLTEMMGTQWFEARVFVIQSLKQKGLCRDSQNSKNTAEWKRWLEKVLRVVNFQGKHGGATAFQHGALRSALIAYTAQSDKINPKSCRSPTTLQQTMGLHSFWDDPSLVAAMCLYGV